MKKLVTWFLIWGLILSLGTPMAAASPRPQVIIENYSIFPNPAPLSQEFTLTITLKNYGSKARDLSFTLNVGELVSPLRRGNVRYLASLAANSEQTLTFQLISEGSPTTKNMNLSADLSYRDNSGNTYTSSQVIGLLFTKKAEAPSELPKIEEAKPHLTISSYTTNPEVIVPGKNFTLTLMIKNNGKSSVKNLLLSLGSMASTVNDSDKGGSQSPQSNSASGALMPYKSGNARYISFLGAGDEEQVEFNLLANPKATAGSYELSLSFEFQSSSGKSFSSAQAIGLNISREASFDWQGLEYPKEVVVGEVFSISGEAINASSFTVGGIKLEFEGDDIEVEDGVLFVGSLESGDSETLEAKARAKKTGLKDAKFVVKYRDDFNQERQVVKVVKIKVNPKPKAIKVPKQQVKEGGFFQGLANFFKALFGIG